MPPRGARNWRCGDRWRVGDVTSGSGCDLAARACGEAISACEGDDGLGGRGTRWECSLEVELIKFMGSKRSLLLNGLGDVIEEESRAGERVVDLFCGSAAVSWFAAAELGREVLACDLQQFAVVLARAVLARNRPLESLIFERGWLEEARAWRREHAAWADAAQLERRRGKDSAWHRRAQRLCQSWNEDDELLVTSRYGGHYFSPMQALSLDAMLAVLPEAPEARDVCLASAIVAASRCAAAPGHTAQPFKATETASKYLLEAWSRDAFQAATVALRRIAPLSVKRRGTTVVGDANEIAGCLRATDVAFVDPPYSAVQYSRFYHVLETVARGWCGEVRGTGRYPSREERPRSLYSQRTKSRAAIGELLMRLSQRGCKVVLTFPLGECSNGLSGEWIEEKAREFFHVLRRTAKSSFSTLGGNATIRAARKEAREMILVLRA